MDVRCHGESASLPTPPGPHGVESSAQDILKLLSQLKLFPEVLIGHSFGGKVVMSMGEQFGASGKRLPRPVQVKCCRPSSTTTPSVPACCYIYPALILTSPDQCKTAAGTCTDAWLLLHIYTEEKCFDQENCLVTAGTQTATCNALYA